LASRAELLAELRAIGERDEHSIDIAETALLLAAADGDDVDLAPYRRHLAEIAAGARAATEARASVELQAQALQQLLAGRHGYTGDAETYDDVRNANLVHVINRRRGLPVALGILFLHAGHAYGADIVGLNFPSHFLVRLAARGQRAILDPFAGGRMMAAADLRQRLKELQGDSAEMDRSHYAEMGVRDVLLRLQNNIKLRAVAAGEIARALDVLETMTAIAPGRGELWWETAVMQSRLGNLKTAIATLEHYLSGSGQASGRDEIEDLLRRLRSRVN
jgi:regulator of sirC expression with transglutaminase-like and TPR domain